MLCLGRIVRDANRVRGAHRADALRSDCARGPVMNGTREVGGFLRREGISLSKLTM